MGVGSFIQGDTLAGTIGLASNLIALTMMANGNPTTIGLSPFIFLISRIYQVIRASNYADKQKQLIKDQIFNATIITTDDIIISSIIKDFIILSISFKEYIILIIPIISLLDVIAFETTITSES